MRERRAAANEMTIYEMARNRKLYPLAQYLDAADVALARDASNLEALTNQMSHQDEGMRWWAVVGLHLLEDNAAQSTGVLVRGLRDEAHEIRMMSAWTLVRLKSDQAAAMKCLDELLFGGTHNEIMLHNVLDWMGEPALPLVKKYIAQDGNRQGRYGIGILGRIAELQGW